jgi:hypothetical protein
VNPKNIFTELKRRNVYRVAVAYGVVAWFLTQLTTQVLLFFEIPNSAVRFVVVALALGFPIAMLLSWVYEFTPEGVVRTEDLSRSALKRSRPYGIEILDFIIIGMLLLIIALLIRGRPFYSQPGESISHKSIAVLPFENLGGLMSIAIIIVRCMAGCLGVILIYSALFLYKDEEDKLENRIEQWWQRIRNLHAHAISRETAFLKVVAEITSKGFTKLFGKRLFGLKAVSASICYSQAATLLFFTFALGRVGESEVIQVRLVSGILCLVFLLFGSLGPFIHRRSPKLFWLAFVLMLTIGWPLLLLLRQWLYFSISVAEIIPFAVACDFLFIVLTRLMLAHAAQSNSFLKIATLGIGNAFLAAVLVVVPIYSWAWLYDHHLFAPIVLPLALLGFSNSLDGLVSLSWFLIAIVMLLHRLFWPLIERPLYALYRHRTF